MSDAPKHASTDAGGHGGAMDRETLKRRSVSGGLANLSGQAAIFALRFCSLLVLARLLQPEDFGLIAMATAVTTFLTLFRDLGLSDATIQRAEITDAQVNTLFWVNVGFGFVAALVSAALAPGLAWFYGDPRLTGVVLGLSGGILLSALRVQPRALLQRRMSFSILVRVEILAHTMAVAAAITAAALDAGYWALVVQYLVMEGVAAGGTAWAAGWRPSRPAWSEGAGELLRFGGDLTGFHLVNYAARNVDDVLIGKFVGPQALGYYANAYKLLLAPIRLIRRPVSNVVIPALSRLQNEPAAFRSYVRSALSMLVFVSMPVITFTFAEADRVVLTLLGDGWGPVVPIFRILAIAALVQSFNVVTGWSYTALGETRRWFRWGLIYSSFITASFVAGLPWGAIGVATSYAIAVVIIVTPDLMYCFAASPLRLADVGRSIWRALVASVAAAGFVFAVRFGIVWPVTVSPVAGLAVSAVVFAAVYLGTVWLLPGGRSFLRRSARLMFSHVSDGWQTS